MHLHYTDVRVFCDALCALAAHLRFALGLMLEVPRSTRRRRLGKPHGTLRHDEWARTGRVQCNGRRSLDLPSMYTNWSNVRHPNCPTAETTGFSPAEKPMPVFYTHNKKVVPQWAGWVRAMLQPIP